MSAKTNKLSIYLIKLEYKTFEEIVKDGTKAHPIEGVGTFYGQESHTNPPDWVNDFFLGALAGSFSIFTASARGLLLTKIGEEANQRIFAIVFGLGRHLLNDDVFEERFGLKVVLNTVVRSSLRSIDKTTLGSVPKQSREQMSRESEASNFGIDIEQDLINAVTGRSKNPKLGKTIAGRDPLSISVKIDLNEIQDFLPICLTSFESEDYKQDFEWIDQIKDVKDSRTLDTLNSWLVDRLAHEELDRIWMAPPTVLDWVDVKGFRYAKRKTGLLHSDLDAREFLATLGDEAITLDLLKSKQVFVVSAKTDDVSDHWNSFACFYAEAHIDGDIFILNNRKWYKIASSFTQQVLDDFANLPESEIVLPAYVQANEGQYNEALPATIPNAICMDRKMIGYGGGHSSIEFCDLLTSDGHLVHIKRYGGAAQFSHLFNQGVVSGELFVQEFGFRQKLNKLLPQNFRLADPTQRPNPSDYEIVFAIISKSNNPLDIPFFSKVGLRNARRRLEAYGYRVRKKKISSLVEAATG